MVTEPQKTAKSQCQGVSQVIKLLILMPTCYSIVQGCLIFHTYCSELSATKSYDKTRRLNNKQWWPKMLAAPHLFGPAAFRLQLSLSVSHHWKLEGKSAVLGNRALQPRKTVFFMFIIMSHDLPTLQCCQASGVRQDMQRLPSLVSEQNSASGGTLDTATAPIRRQSSHRGRCHPAISDALTWQKKWGTIFLTPRYFLRTQRNSYRSRNSFIKKLYLYQFLNNKTMWIHLRLSWRGIRMAWLSKDVAQGGTSNGLVILQNHGCIKIRTSVKNHL